jgi:FlaA1/EpsC-like NDP-sugar epimerase
MGASKRFSELVLQALHHRGSSTRFCMVRFGNVLESSGSVVPLFRAQIRQGGPITVTHPEIIRYFMTIPEAAQLVIQAGAMGEGGDVFVLDMGKPVKIDDLARRLVKLVGLTVKDEENPDGDIEICYTGLRPAEKLYEELLIGNNVAGTQHPRIMRAIEESLSWRKIHEYLEQLQLVTQTFNCARAREILCQAVAGYTPACRVEDLVWQQRERLVRPAVESGKVADLGRFVSEKLN